MATWIVFLIVSLLFFIAEIFTPTMFFLNFAAASAVCSFVGIFTDNHNILIPLFAILSILFILFLRPLLNINPQKINNSAFESQYVNKMATAITNITPYSGRIKIYDESWEARTLPESPTEIPEGSKVKIISHNDLTMFVEKKGKK